MLNSQTKPEKFFQRPRRTVKYIAPWNSRPEFLKGSVTYKCNVWTILLVSRVPIYWQMEPVYSTENLRRIWSNAGLKEERSPLHPCSEPHDVQADTPCSVHRKTRNTHAADILAAKTFYLGEFRKKHHLLPPSAHKKAASKWGNIILLYIIIFGVFSWPTQS